MNDVDSTQEPKSSEPGASFTPEQCRAARAALKWTVLDTYRISGVSNSTLVKFEAAGKVRIDRIKLLRAAFEANGVVFSSDGRGISW